MLKCVYIWVDSQCVLVYSTGMIYKNRDIPENFTLWEPNRTALTVDDLRENMSNPKEYHRLLKLEANIVTYVDDIIIYMMYGS